MGHANLLNPNKDADLYKERKLPDKIPNQFYIWNNNPTSMNKIRKFLKDKCGCYIPNPKWGRGGYDKHYLECDNRTFSTSKTPNKIAFDCFKANEFHTKYVWKVDN